jgi:hypothetical protein
MSRALVCLLIAAAIAPGTALALDSFRQTPRQAEVNVLHATRTLGRYSKALLNPKTGLLQNNSTAICKGIGPAQAGTYASFRCVVSAARVRVYVRYIAQTHNGFELRLLRVLRVR